MTAPTSMELRAAIALCRLQAKACNVDREDLWKLHIDDFVKEAREVLGAVGAPDILRELENTASMLQSACLVISDATGRSLALEQVRAARAAIGKAGGAA